MILKFQGNIQFGVSSRNAYGDDLEGVVFIDGRDVLREVAEAEFSKKVTVAIADERFDGDLAVEIGWGYSEYTPMEWDALTVGEHNIIEILERNKEGSIVTLWIADEPFNVLE